MDKGENLFNELVEKFTEENKDVAFGKMMSSPALKYKGKVFAFFYNGKITFKLGEAFNPESFGLTNVELLNPFKTKGPLKGWYVIGYHDSKHWETLTKQSLENLRGK